MTRSEAISANYRDEFYHATLRGSDKRPMRCRVNGACKVWKTRPNEFRLPVKHGLRDCFYIDESNADEWLLEEPSL